MKEKLAAWDFLTFKIFLNFSEIFDEKFIEKFAINHKILRYFIFSPFYVWICFFRIFPQKMQIVKPQFSKQNWIKDCKYRGIYRMTSTTECLSWKVINLLKDFQMVLNAIVFSADKMISVRKHWKKFQYIFFQFLRILRAFCATEIVSAFSNFKNFRLIFSKCKISEIILRIWAFLSYRKWYTFVSIS